LLLARRWEGMLLAGLINLPYLVLPFRELNYRYSATYWTGILVLALVLFALRLRDRRGKARLAGEEAKREAPAAADA